MALIVCNYLNFFVYGRESRCFFERGEVSYFDPIERCFLRINPSKGDIPQDHWIPIPVIKEADAIRNYLRLSANTTLVQDYAYLNDIDFSIEVVRIAEKIGFENCLWGYVQCHYGEIISKWIEENNIPNCKLRCLRPLMRVHTPEDAIKFRELIQEQLRLEALQEEEFKKSLR